jgi:hypothetical protein
MPEQGIDELELDRVLDALVGGDAGNGSTTLDRDVIETIHAVRALAATPLPRSSHERSEFALHAEIARLDTTPANEATMTDSVLSPVDVLTHQSNGGINGALFGDRILPASSNGRMEWPLPARSPSRDVTRGGWLRTHLATAALVLVVLIGMVLVFEGIRLKPVNSAILPAALLQAGTPEGTDETQFAITFPAPVLPAGRVYAWSTLYTFKPGVSAAYPGFPIEDPAAALVWVQAGTMAIDGEPVAVHRASEGTSLLTSAPGELLLGAGDAVGLELGPGHSYQLRNAGPEPLVFAEFWLIGGPRPQYTYPPGYVHLDYHNHPDAATLTSPATVTMHLTQALLEPDETLAPPENSWQLALAERSSGLLREQNPNGAVKNTSQTPVSVVAMTAEFSGWLPRRESPLRWTRQPIAGLSLTPRHRRQGTVR